MMMHLRMRMLNRMLVRMHTGMHLIIHMVMVMVMAVVMIMMITTIMIVSVIVKFVQTSLPMSMPTEEWSAMSAGKAGARRKGEILLLILGVLANHLLEASGLITRNKKNSCGPLSYSCGATLVESVAQAEIRTRGRPPTRDGEGGHEAGFKIQAGRLSNPS